MNFQKKIMLVVSVFTISLTVVSALYNNMETKKNLIQQENDKRNLVQQNTVKAIYDIDSAYYIFDDNLNKDMEKQTNGLIEEYKKNPHVETWDLNDLKKRYGGYEIYLINQQDVVQYTTYAKDLHLDFKKIAPTWYPMLDQKRETGIFSADATGVEDLTGLLKKYTYEATPDKKYVVELGYALEDGEIYKRFNFVQAFDELAKKYNNVDKVITWSDQGHSMGISDKNGNVIQIEPQYMKVINEIVGNLKKGDYQSIDVQDNTNGKEIVRRFVPYEFQAGNQDKTTRIIEIDFNQVQLDQILKDNQIRFYMQLIVTILISLLISFVISRIISRPMYLAFHDLLTGITNRAGFENALHEGTEHARKKGRKIALMNIDLDNFKKVNDTLGHDGGDFLLKDVGRRIKASLRSENDIAARLGGDEFVVLLHDVKDESVACEVAERILEELKRPIIVNGHDVTKTHNVTASIGVALLPDHAQDGDGLYKKADLALYKAKQSGKATYKVYDDSMQK